MSAVALRIVALLCLLVVAGAYAHAADTVTIGSKLLVGLSTTSQRATCPTSPGRGSEQVTDSGCSPASVSRVEMSCSRSSGATAGIPSGTGTEHALRAHAPRDRAAHTVPNAPRTVRMCCPVTVGKFAPAPSRRTSR